MRMRVSVKPSASRIDDLRVASSAKSQLSAYPLIWEDSEHPLHGIHRDCENQFYFEFATENPEAARDFINTLPTAARLEVLQDPPIPGEGCENCGNIAGPILPSVCPNCEFRDISPCPNPNCPDREVPRKMYIRFGGNELRCPRCATRVLLRFNEPMFRADGSFNSPLIVVELAEAVAAHDN